MQGQESSWQLAPTPPLALLSTRLEGLICSTEHVLGFGKDF